MDGSVVLADGARCAASARASDWLMFRLNKPLRFNMSNIDVNTLKTWVKHPVVRAYRKAEAQGFPKVSSEYAGEPGHLEARVGIAIRQAEIHRLSQANAEAKCLFDDYERQVDEYLENPTEVESPPSLDEIYEQMQACEIVKMVLCLKQSVPSVKA